MPFATILKRWRKAGKRSQADLADTALQTFLSKYPQVFANLDTDNQITQAKREELLEQIILVDVEDPEPVEAKVLGYCRSRQCSGRANATAQGATLAHVEERGKTEKTFESTAFAKTPLARKNRSSVLFVDALLSKSLTEQQSLLNGKLLSRWIMWSFFQSRRSRTPFYGVSKDKSELIRRLGLGRADRDEEFLLWEHTLEPHQTAHRPTAFDAEAYDFFRPGGKTQPLSGNDGLQEIVHPPVTGNQLAAPIESVP